MGRAFPKSVILNWLAHLFLSPPSAEYRLGNLLPDLMRPEHYAHLPAEVQQGIACHRLIDSFTDTHPVVRSSIRRLPVPYSKLGGILVDVFYDHFLALDWHVYSEVPLESFAQEAYRGFRELAHWLPEDTATRLLLFADADVLCSYRTLEGIDLTLQRISRRMRSLGAELATGVRALEECYQELRGDFAVFFPELRARVEEFQKA